MIGRWTQLVAAAALASEVFGDDELEAYAAAHPPADVELAAARRAYIEAAPHAAAAVIARQEPALIERRAGLGWLRPVTSDPRYLGAKLKFQTHLLLRRYRVSR